MHIAVGDQCPGDWDLLVAGCRWGTFYHGTDNLELLKALSPTEPAYISCREDGRLIAGMAFAVQPGPLGNVVNCLPYFGSFGDAIAASEAPMEAEKAVYESLVERCRALDALCLTVITSPFADFSHHEKVRHALSPTFVDRRLCQIVHLPECDGSSDGTYVEKILGMMEGRARTAYRKILRHDFELSRCRTESQALEFAETHKDNIGKKGGIFKTTEFFLKAFEMSQRNPDRAEMAVMLDKGRVIAGVVLFYYAGVVEYHTTCLLDEYRSIGPLNRIIIDKMIEAGHKGFRFWNFGGTWKTQQGVYLFKQSFGASDHDYWYFTIFFRDLDRVKTMSSEEIVREYPLCYVIPFTELPG